MTSDPWARLRTRRDRVVRNHPGDPLARIVLTLDEFDLLLETADRKDKPALRAVNSRGGRV